MVDSGQQVVTDSGVTGNSVLLDAQATVVASGCDCYSSRCMMYHI